MTPIAEELIRRLRYDPETRGEFDISTWEDRRECGTVRCIAGSAVHLARDPSPLGERQILWDHSLYLTPTAQSYTELAAKLLGIPFMRTARDLFMPWEAGHRVGYHGDRAFDSYPEQARPDLSTIEKMRRWAAEVSSIPAGNAWQSCITPDRAAYALERVTKDEIPYCNWAEAFENA